MKEMQDRLFYFFFPEGRTASTEAGKQKMNLWGSHAKFQTEVYSCDSV